MGFDFKNASAAERKAECKRIGAEVGDDLFFTKKELAHLPEILLDGERVISFTSGMMDGNTWLITLTDKRIVFLDKGLLYGLKQVVIDLDKVNAVSGETGLLLGSISIQDGATTHTIKNVQKKTVVNFTNKIRDALEERKRPQSSHLTSTNSAEATDVISQLERLASLKEKGILSQDEFEQQKSKLIQSESYSTKPRPELVHADKPLESAGSVNPTQTQKASGEVIHSRKLSTRLIAGIVVFPFLFSWFTLGKGYSKKAKIFSFSWLFITLIAAFGGESNKQPVATTPEAKQDKPVGFEREIGEAKPYTIISGDMKTKSRKETFFVAAPLAETKGDRAGTAKKAARDIFEKTGIPVVTVFVEHDKLFAGKGSNLAKATYFSDACNFSGSDCNGIVWDVAASNVTVTEKEWGVYRDWIKNRSRYLDKNGDLNEEKLKAFLAKKYGVKPDDVHLPYPSIDYVGVNPYESEQDKQAEKDKAFAKKAVIEARVERVKTQFNPWDGSHRILESAIQKSMNDPDSYEHVETTYRDLGDSLIVSTTFRGKNGFGGVVKNTVVAQVDLDGNIMEIISE
ncbi:PH domain-containing protein [Aeromonas salmonicida]|uniref:DUF4875 domain-containing protein n=1 Tax=Aeromonas salmonicida TaxID=645 RepID=UPI001BAA9D27|nr:PH domain-containing protein [Aeromonas salmonicida]MBS2782699.1 PH domain-containing protein [Aeromonas salmonicida]